MLWLTIWPHREIRGWSGDPVELATLPLCETVPALEALDRRYTTDAHTWPGYVVTADGAVQPTIPRLAKASLPVLRGAGARVLFGVLLVDLDDPEAHRTRTEASASWRAQTLTALSGLPPSLRPVSWYWTRGGARLLWALSRPVDPDELERLGRVVRSILRQHDLPPDELTDWTRCFRLPRVRRDNLDQDLPGDWSQLAHSRLQVDELLAQVAPPTAAPSLFAGVGAARPPFELLADVEVGGRNTYLARCAGKLRSLGLDEDGILAGLRGLLATRYRHWTPREGEVEQIARSAARYDAPPLEAAEELVERPEIRINMSEVPRMLAELGAALRPHNFYRRGGKLVSPVRDADSTLTVHVYRPRAAWAAAAAVADWRKFEPAKGNDPLGKWVAAPPPYSVVCAYLEGELAELRPLAGLSEIPILRPDGSLHSTPGYDEVTGVLYDPGPTEFPTVPDAPTKAQAAAALDELDDLLVDFPFATPADRSAALAAFLTVISRPAVDIAPIFLVNAHTRGSGKGLIVHLAAAIGTGRPATPTPPPTVGEEWDKRITALLWAGRVIVVFDNVSKAFGNECLDVVLTSAVYQSRKLGESTILEVPNKATWFATGNNLTITGDLGRRALRISIDVPLERPEERDGFKYPDLLEHAIRNRPRLVAAALTVVRAYFAAGQPPLPLRAFGSFSRWSRLVRAPLVWLERPDPLDSQTSLAEEADVHQTTTAELLHAWRSYFGNRAITCSGAVQELQICRGSPGAARLVEAIEEAVSRPLHDARTAGFLGWRFRALKNRLFQGLRIRQDGTRQRTGTLWVVEEG